MCFVVLAFSSHFFHFRSSSNSVPSLSEEPSLFAPNGSSNDSCGKKPVNSITGSVDNPDFSSTDHNIFHSGIWSLQQDPLKESLEQHGKKGRISHPVTGERISLADAVDQGLVDTKLGEIVVNPETGERISLEEAVTQGLVDSQLEELLKSNCGIYDPRTRKQLSLLEAIDKGLFDLNRGAFVDPKTGEVVTVDEAVKLGIVLQEKVSDVQQALTIMSCTAADVPNLVEAIRNGSVNPRTGQFKKDGGSGSRQSCSVAEALKKGWIDPVSPTIGGQTAAGGMSLFDALQQGLVDFRSGKIVDRFSGKCIKISDAVKRGLLNPTRLEIYDGKSRQKVDLQTALETGLINEESGKYVGGKSELSFSDASKKNLIYNPLTFKECDDNELLEKDNRIRDPVTNDVMNLLDAIGAGILDTDLKSIRDISAGEFVTLPDAMRKDIVDIESGEFQDSATGIRMTLADAVKKGHLTTVCQKSIFDIEGIKDQMTGDYMSFNTALDNGTIDKVTSKLIDKKTKAKLGFAEAAEKGLIQPQLLDMLKKSIGITNCKGKELTLLEAVSEGKIDPNSGLLIDSATTNTVPLERALAKDMITPMGAAILKSLLNITVTTATVTQTVRRTIKVSSSEKDEGAITFDDALRQGLIDDNSGIFTHPETGKELPLDEAINLGLLKLTSSSTVIRSSSTALSEAHSRSSSLRSRVSPDNNNKFSDTSPNSSRGGSPDKIGRKDSSSSSTRSTTPATGTTCTRKTSSSTSSSTTSTGGSPIRKLSSPVKSGQPMRKDSHVESLDTQFESGISNVREVSKSVTSSSSYQQATTTTSSPSSTTRSDSVVSRNIAISVSDGYKNGSSSSSSAARPSVSVVSSIDMPADGFPLKDAIDKNLLDASKGIFILGDNKPINLKESISQGLIDPKSAQVVLDDEQPGLNLSQAMVAGVLDDCGNLNDGRRSYTLQQAIRTSRVKYIRYGGRRYSSRTSLVSEIEEEDDFIELHERIRFKKDSGTFEVHPDLSPADLLNALQEGKLRPSDIIVRHPDKNQCDVNILEAIRSNVINKSTGEYTTDKGKKYNIVDAIKFGYITFMGKPGSNLDKNTQRSTVRVQNIGGETTTSSSSLVRTSGGGTIHARIVQSGVTTTKISSFMVEIPGTGEEVTLEEAVRRGLVSEETAKMYQPETSTDSQVQSTVVLITDPETGEEVESDEAIRRGIVTRSEVQEFLRMKEEQNGASTTTNTTAVVSEAPFKSTSPLKGIPSRPYSGSPIKDSPSLPSNGSSGSLVKEVPKVAPKPTPKPYGSTLSSRTPSPTKTSENGSSSSSSPKASSQYGSNPSSKSPSPSKTSENGCASKPSASSKRDEEFPDSKPSPSNGFQKSYPKDRDSIVLPKSSSPLSARKSTSSASSPRPSPDRESRPTVAPLRSSSGTKSPSKSVVTPFVKDSAAKASRPASLSPNKAPSKKAPSSSKSSPEKSISRSSSLRTKSKSPRRKRHSSSSSSGSSSSNSSSSSSSSVDDDKDSYRSEMTIDIERGIDVSCREDIVHTSTVHKTEKARHTVTTKIVNLKPGYALSSLDEVRNLATGETMSVYEAKLRGIATDVSDKKANFVTEQIKIFVSEAVNKGLVNFSSGTFTNPSTGQDMSIAEAIKLGLLITEIKEQEEVVQYEVDAPTISLRDAFQHCFDAKTKKFTRKSTNDTYSLEEAVSAEWVNGKDIIFDVSTSKQNTLQEAIDKGVLNGKTCEYTILSTKKKMFILEAASKGFVAVFPEPVPELELSEITYSLQETFENGIFSKVSNMFMEVNTQQQITILQALKIGLVDFRSAEVKNTKTNKNFNLMEAIESGLINKKTGMFRNIKEKTEMTLIKALESGLITLIERDGSPFECITFWEAIDRKQLDTKTGMFYSVHEENKKMTLEEAVYRKYIDKKSAFIKDTWKRKYCSLSEASRKKIIKDGKVMNTTTGKYLSIREAIDIDIIVREIKFLSLIDVLDYGMYLPHSGTIQMPGFDREITVREAIEFKLIDHQKTIVKSQKSNRYTSTLEAMRSGEIDGMTGMYGSMNLLEARSKGYLLTNDAMVRQKKTVNDLKSKPKNLPSSSTTTTLLIPILIQHGLPACLLHPLSITTLFFSLL